MLFWWFINKAIVLCLWIHWWRLGAVKRWEWVCWEEVVPMAFFRAARVHLRKRQWGTHWLMGTTDFQGLSLTGTGEEMAWDCIVGLGEGREGSQALFARSHFPSSGPCELLQLQRVNGEGSLPKLQKLTTKALTSCLNKRKNCNSSIIHIWGSMERACDLRAVHQDVLNPGCKLTVALQG